ncbi:MAG: glycine/betaine ABC transporter, partial [Leeuwenhoekiella sp.]|nr:glycine/betaine ABC transporter [Leeuwenhoekiella sp.]
MKLLKTIKKNLLLLVPTGILLLVAFLIFGFTEESYALIETLSTHIRSYFGRFYLILGLACVLVLVVVASSPLGKYKLGTPAEKPAFNRLSWIAMLYSAGMGA